jgi:hypothetical protein
MRLGFRHAHENGHPSNAYRLHYLAFLDSRECGNDSSIMCPSFDGYGYTSPRRDFGL